KSNRKIVYIQHKKNMNGAAARNSGIKISKGEYIGFLDDDDYFIDTKIEEQVNYLTNNNKFDGVYTWRIQNNKKYKANYTGDLSKQLLLLKFTPTTSSLLFRREAVEKLK